MAGTSPWAVLAEPRRRRLVNLCAHRPRSVKELHRAMPDVTLGAVSQHLGRLRTAGILSVQQRGRQRLYVTRPDAIRQLHRELDSMWGASLDRLAELASK